VTATADDGQPRAGDWYRARQKVAVRDAPSPKAKKLLTIEEGVLVEGLEFNRSVAGRMMRCHQGWVNVSPAFFDRIPRRKLTHLSFEFEPSGSQVRCWDTPRTQNPSPANRDRQVGGLASERL
jgi:hypothetical protein